MELYQYIEITMITLRSQYNYYLYLTNRELCLGHIASWDLIQKCSFRVHSPEYSLSILSVSQICYQRQHSDDATSKCPNISLGLLFLETSFLLPWLSQIHPFAGISSPPGFCLTDWTRYTFPLYFFFLFRSVYLPILNKSEKHNEFLNQI